MTVSLSNLSIGASMNGTKSESASKDVLSYSDTYTFSSGTGTGAVNDFWYSTGTLTATGSIEIKVSELTRSFLNNTVSQSFATIKGIYIENSATGAGQYFTVTATGSRAFTEIFNGGSGNLKVEQNGVFTLSNPGTGWAVVSGTGDSIQLNDGGNAATYRISLLGILA